MLSSFRGVAARQVIGAIGSLIFPPRCLICRSYLAAEPDDKTSLSSVFCPTCLGNGTEPFIPPYCPRCGHVFELGENHLCEACLKKNPRFRRIGRVRAALIYTGLTKKAVPLFKYQSKLCLARDFEQLLFQAFDTHFTSPEPDLLIPVPLHPRKMRKRGFNQSFLLIRHFSKFYWQKYGRAPSWKIDTGVLERIIHTRPQTGLDEKSRRKNLKNAFQISTKRRDLVKNARILLIDDVYTTGTTCTEAAKVLFRNQAKEVNVLVFARA